MSEGDISAAARLWRIGGDTMDIAEALDVSEATVFNHLRFIRARAAGLHGDASPDGHA
jgi:hypothetical protein